MSSHSLIGRDIGNYTVVRLIGEGGMGAVFEVRHRFLGDRAALKVLHGSYAHNPQVAQRFFQEAKSAREIGHPSIIRVFDFGQSDDGSLYLVMELLAGQSLSQIIAEGPIPEATAARIAAVLAEGLAAAHAKGVIHRDLKPDNVFLTAEGVKILDFGIAKVLTTAGQTGTNAILGTPKYMAPEQARGARSVGPQTDIWSLGVILFQMVTGQLPFEGTDLVEIIFKLSTETPPRPSTLGPVSPSLESIILACLEKDPAARPPGMAELRALLAPWAGDGGGSSPPLVPTPRPSGAIGISTNPTTLSGTSGQRAPRGLRHSGRWVLYALGGLTLVGAGGGVWFGLRHSAAPPAATAIAQRAPARTPATTVTPAPLPAPAQPREKPPTAVEATIILRTEPPGAKIYRQGALLGITPKVVTAMLPAEFSFSLDGYKEANEVVTTPGPAVVKLRRAHSTRTPGGGPGNSHRPHGDSSGRSAATTKPNLAGASEFDEK